MERQRKAAKPPGFFRLVVAANINRLIDHHYRNLPNLTQRQRQLAKDSGVAFSTIQRIMKREVGASLDNLESIATAFQIQMYQLMLPELDVTNPQVVNGASAQEKRLYELWRRKGTLIG